MTLRELLGVLRERLSLVIALPIIFALIMAVVTVFMPDQYTASTTMYVLSKTGDGTEEIRQTDLTASQMITNDVAQLIKSSRVRKDVADRLGLDNLSGYTTNVTSSTTTRILTLSVRGGDPQRAADIANETVRVTSDISQEVMNLQSINAVDEAIAPTSPSGPRRLRYIAVAAAAGLFMAVAIAVLLETLNVKARNGEEVEELLDVPVVGHIPALGA
ncbi:MAG: lipopolysaccharide biosynthesis protein [Atopobiaceae bacterium]|nr:lipopolysaccharide biosynthesis protein [Atopobiaceae bacterium]